MSHIFISYSTKNSDYAEKLANKLRREGFDVWIDNARLRSSQDWWRSIVLALRDSDAFIVILTPEADESAWVQDEITLARKYKKPTFPLWLSGNIDTPNWEIFVRIQVENVLNGKLPAKDFYDNLARVAPRKSRPGKDVTSRQSPSRVKKTPKAPAASEPAALQDTTFEPLAVVDLPDWLKDEPESKELDKIVANIVEQEQSVIPPPSVEQSVAVPPIESESILEGSMSWLESLAADQGVEFPSLDFSSIVDDLASPSPAAPTANAVDWMENLAQSEGMTKGNTAPVSEAANADDPMAWLESLAKRQGTNKAELATDAVVEDQVAWLDSLQPAEWKMTDAEIQSALARGKVVPHDQMEDWMNRQLEIGTQRSEPEEGPAIEDTATWLDSLATAQIFDTSLTTESFQPTEWKMTDAEIQAALARGEIVPHDQMEDWMNRQLEMGMQRSEPEKVSVYDPDTPVVWADIPDWLQQAIVSQDVSIPPPDGSGQQSFSKSTSTPSANTSDAPTNDTPDFDKMTPEEIMAWMESLAKKPVPYKSSLSSIDIKFAEAAPPKGTFNSKKTDAVPIAKQKVTPSPGILEVLLAWLKKGKRQ